MKADGCWLFFWTSLKNYWLTIDQLITMVFIKEERQIDPQRLWPTSPTPWSISFTSPAGKQAAWRLGGKGQGAASCFYHCSGCNKLVKADQHLVCLWVFHMFHIDVMNCHELSWIVMNYHELSWMSWMSIDVIVCIIDVIVCIIDVIVCIIDAMASLKKSALW